MECTCIRYTELPHAPKLFTDLVYHPERVSQFYPYPPYDPASYVAAASQVELAPERRASLVAALRAQNGDSQELDLLARPGTVAVVTGQQVGLLSGPAYTIYKALTAAKVARTLTSQGIAAVPVFWLATEDHDFAEINHCWTFDSQHRPIRLEIDGTGPPNQPVGEVKITSTPLDVLEESLRDFPFRDDVLALVAEAYTPGRSLGQAFGALLKRLLSSYGLIHIDPMSPAIRELAAPAMRSALSSAADLSRLVLERNRELTSLGYHAQVHVEEKTSFVFLLEDGQRIPLRRDGPDYISQGRRFSSQELMERAHQLSPNALLRPVIQDSILPTVAYVGGPAELAYLAQSQVIYRAILGRMPVALHRTGFTLLDQRSRKLMSRYGLTLADFFHGECVLRERASAKLVPPAIAKAIQQTSAVTGLAFQDLGVELAGFDPTLAKALEKTRKKVTYQVSKLERKIARESLARDAKAGRDASYLYGLIYPHKHLQERLYSITPFLARHGMDLIDRLYDSVRLECPDHQLIVV